jgi:hypothetical protein
LQLIFADLGGAAPFLLSNWAFLLKGHFSELLVTCKGSIKSIKEGE